MGTIRSYWDFDGDPTVTCPTCSWSGHAAGNVEPYRDLLDVTCPTCGTTVLIVPYPSAIETARAAAAGNERAQRELEVLDAAASRRGEWDAQRLQRPDQLPEIDGDEVIIDWDFETVDDEHWQVLRHGDVEIWRELAFWESDARFEQVLDVLRARYGMRLAMLRPTPASELYLYGDDHGSVARVAALNASLR